MRIDRLIIYFCFLLLFILSALHICTFCSFLSTEKQIREINVLIEETKIENEEYRSKLLTFQTMYRIEKIAKYLGFTEKTSPQTIKDDTIALR